MRRRQVQHLVQHLVMPVSGGVSAVPVSAARGEDALTQRSETTIITTATATGLVRRLSYSTPCTFDVFQPRFYRLARELYSLAGGVWHLPRLISGSSAPLFLRPGAFFLSPLRPKATSVPRFFLPSTSWSKRVKLPRYRREGLRRKGRAKTIRMAMMIMIHLLLSRELADVCSSRAQAPAPARPLGSA